MEQVLTYIEKEDVLPPIEKIKFVKQISTQCGEVQRNTINFGKLGHILDMFAGFHYIAK